MRVAAVGGCLVALWCGIAAASASATTYTVNSSSGSPSTTCDATTCTLPGAITAANANPGKDTIAFNLPSATITVANQLPSITDPVVVDGTTDPNYTPTIEGTTAEGSVGLEVDAGGGGSVIRGLQIQNFTAVGINLLDGNVRLVGNVLLGDDKGVWIQGTDANTLLANRIQGNGTAGVLVDSADANVIGGLGAGQANVISGNGDGVRLIGTTSGNVVQGNLIGTTADGQRSDGNVNEGVYLEGLATANRIGPGNVISGNTGAGVELVGLDCDSNVVQGNDIGTDSTGAFPVPNQGGGVVLNGSPNNTIGGTVPGAGNVISGNNGDGVTLVDDGATGNHVLGNLIGTDARGAFPLGNTGFGIYVGGAPSNTLGGTDAGAGNVISANGRDGIRVFAAAAGDAEGNLVQGNLIGTDAAGTAALGNTESGILIGDAGLQVGGTTPAARNVVSGNVDGIEVNGVGSTTPLIEGNYIGTSADGTALLGNAHNGVFVHGTGKARIGDVVPGGGNVISGNFNGILLDVGTSGTVVRNNRIGTNAAGTAALGNAFEGVKIDHSTAHIIGGTGPLGGNLISGNGGGVRISGDGITTPMGNKLLRNWIGTTGTGGADLGNVNNGVFLDNARGNTIGAPGGGNVVSGNGLSGIRFLDTNSVGNVIQSNYVGLNAAGTAKIPNDLDGVFIDRAPGTTIGGSAAGTGNVISGNTKHGIELSGATTVNTNVLGNLVGTTASGTTALGNLGTGVQIVSGAHATTISGNTIGFNKAAGVNVGAGVANRISADSIFTNGALGINLGPSGPNPNDAGDGDTGPNGLQNYPVLASATRGAGTITIAGSLNSLASTTFRLEFFASAHCDGSGFGEGKQYLGTTNVTTNGSGNATFSAPLAATVAAGSAITATAIAPNGNTSEFSACRAAS